MNWFRVKVSSFDSERPKVDCDEAIELVLITFFFGSKANKMKDVSGLVVWKRSKISHEEGHKEAYRRRTACGSGIPRTR